MNRTDYSIRPPKRRLTPRQMQVALATAQGLQNKEVAKLLGMSVGTVKNHLHAIYWRLGVDGRIPLVLWLLRDGAPFLPKANPAQGAA